jgi:diphthine-ammonia ligase
MKSANRDSFMLHTSNIELAELGSKALEIPIFFGKTEGQKEAELEDISRTIATAKEQYNFEVISSGALASKYQKERVERIGKSQGLRVVSPLWNLDQVTYLRTLVMQNYKFILTSVSCQGLDGSFLGNIITPALAEEVISRSSKFGFNPAFEGGEAETFVLDCPLFQKQRIRITGCETLWDGYTGSLQITRADLETKVGVQDPLT